MEEFLNSTFGVVLRWLFFIPGAFLAMFITPFLFNLIWSYGSMYEESILFYLFKTFLSAGVGSFSYIYVGSTIAPKFRRIVSVSLCSIFITLYILFLLGFIQNGFSKDLTFGSSWKLIISAVFFLVGSIIGVASIWDEYDLKQ